MAQRSPVKYRRDGKYRIQEHVGLTNYQKHEAELQGKKDAKNPFDVMRDHATEYEKTMQKHWEQEIDQRSSVNMGRAYKWGDLAQRELKDLIIVKKEYEDRLKARLGSGRSRITDSHLRKVPYIFILSVITAVEIPINVKVFDIFGENVIFTFILGGMLSIILAYIAHNVGSWIKSDGLRFRSIGLILLVLAMITLVAFVRFVYLTSVDFSPVKEYFKTDLQQNVIAALFFIINLLLFICSIIASYISHDSDPLFIKAERMYKKLFEKVGNLSIARQEEMINLRRSIARCQESFKEQRHIYIDSYRSAGAAEPMCFKESITVEVERIKHIQDQIKALEENFNAQKQLVDRALTPVEL